MKRERPSIEKLIPLTFNDLNLMYEGKINGTPCILKPDKSSIDKSVVANADHLWCEYFSCSNLLRKEFAEQKDNKDLHKVEIKLPFKLFLDNNQELIIRHNTFSYRTRADVPITINKPYVAVIFDEIPEVHFMCFDIFRNQYSVFEVQYKISAFPISATYERIFLGLQKMKYHKFIFEYWCEVRERNERKYLNAPFYCNISKA